MDMESITEATHAARQAIIQRFRGIAAEYEGNKQRIADLQEQINVIVKRQDELVASAQDCHAAARLFDLDLVAAAAAQTHQEAPTPLTRASYGSPEPPSVKEFVLREAEAAHPNPVRASALRKLYQDKFGPELHEKTIGMTLYRLSRKQALRRRGIDWYFVPETERTAQEEGADA